MKKILFSFGLLALLLLSVRSFAQTTYTKITSTSGLEVGAHYLIVGHHDALEVFAMGYQKTNNRNAVVVAESGDAITVTLGTDPTSATDVFQFTLGGGAGAWTFFDEVKEGYLYAASSSGNQLKTQTTLDANGQWSITFNSDGTAEVVAQGENTRNNMRFNPNTSNGDPLFSCYLESSNVDTRVSFYKAGGTSEPDHAFVDLGLPSGTLWATCNVGADTPEDYGDHFAWGETLPKDYYGWNTYQYCNGSGSSLTKYCSNSSYGYNGFTDNLTTLLPEDDAATVNWGDDWRMPTEEEWQELFQNTPYTLSTQNGVNGWLFTASNGNSLFLPFPGYLSSSSTYFAGNYGYYWSSSLYTPQPNYAYYLYCGSDGDYGFYSNFGRGRGLSVRAVRSGSPSLSYTINVMANPEEGGTVTGDGTYNQGATCTLTATANNGYSFTNWTKNGTEVSTNHSYSFTVTEDATFVANFSALDDDPLTYSINDDGVSVTVTGHIDGTAATGELVIPETKTIDGVTYTVTGIGNNAFKDCTGLTGNLVIPNSVITIGDYAFQGCFAMQGSLTIGTSVTEIWKEAFQNCGFHTVNFNATGCTHMCTIIGVDHYFVFSGCNNLTTLNIGENVQIIPDYAFYECSGLTGNLTIPNSVVSIGQSAFGYCNGFTGDLIIPNSVTTIGGYAFLNCSGFTGALTIGTSVTEIGVGAFGGCYNFTTVNFNASNCTTMGGDGSSNNPFYSYNNPTGPTNAILNIGENVQTIPEYAFSGCSGLTGALNLPESLVSIGFEAFAGCNGLTGDLVIPNSVTTIGNLAFLSCSGFTGLTLGESLVSIGEPSTYNYDGPFCFCSGFTGSLTIPNSVTFIKNGSFTNCSGFTNLTIGNSVTEIGGGAFYNCSGFTGSLTIPNSVTMIGEEAFRGCSGFTGDLTIGNSVTSIGQWAFVGCNGFTGSLTIGNSMTTIGNGAFKDCSGFTGSLTIPNSVTTIQSSAFRNCSGFNSLTIGNSVTSIWDYAFYDCSGLAAINVLAENPPETSVYFVFFNVSNNIPVTVPCGTSGAYQNATGWSSFTNIQEDCDPLTYSINDDGVSVTVTGHVDGTGATGPLIIPETKTIDGVTYTVTAIKNDAFRNYRGLTGDLVIPNSVVTIGSRAFMNCSGFTGLTLGNSLTTISIGAFSNCNSFTGSLILPESLTIIVGNAFQNCSGFTGNLTIPAGVTSLGGAFAGCSGFTSLTMLPTVPPVNNPFGSSPYDIPVTVPCGSWSLYRYAYDWTGFTSIQEDCSGTYEVMATANPTEGGSAIFGTEGETLFADSFGSYTAGSTIAAEAAAVSHDWWTTWSGQTGGDDDGMVVDYGGTRCGHLTYGNDQVLLLNKESGIYEIEFDILVPEGKNAFFSFLHQFDETVNEAVYCHLHMTNVNYQNTITPYHGSIRAGNYNLTDIPCVFDAWMHFRFYVDMDADIARCYYTAPESEEMLLCQWPWSWNSNTAAYTDSGLAAMDFWPPMDEATSEYYIDNFSLKQYEVGNTMLPGNHFAPGSTCTLTAVANEDYAFSNWTENGNIVSTDATYSFTVTDDRTLVANFDQATPTNYVITATANPTEGGTVTIGGMANLLYDSFEMYNLGSKLSVAATSVGHDWWTTWDNAPGGIEDGVVASYNDNQCAHFTYGNDQILLLGNAVSGQYDLQFNVLVPNGKNGYFNVMHHFAGSQSSWAMECYLHMTNDGFNSTSAPGHGTVHAGSIGTCDLPCVYDEWMHYRIHIDIDNDVAQLYFNVVGQPEVMYAEWQWSLNIFGTEVVDGTIEAVDFYPPQNYSTSEFYVDNVRFSQFNGRYSTASNDGHTFVEMNSERDAVRNYEYYEYGATCILNAMANEGYSFVNWTKNDSVVSTNNSYSFTVTEDATFVANFASEGLHWEVDPEEFPNSMSVMGVILIDSVEQYNPSWEIGAFH
ncbi:MAG: leucine-rich repeat protein, partial [Muribaculaceae bacterium]|nr:leucine-rich repeat protein [Muribaculaceae bacterium]